MKKFILPLFALISALQFIACNGASKETEDSKGQIILKMKAVLPGDDSKR
ncbi:MAG: hypothetical protein IPH42_18925 [Bacteroidetes bacterium]|nr:hypothetical protein [Bacteroidota bacterium]